MSEERKKSGAEKAIDKAEAKARHKLITSLGTWSRIRSAQRELSGGPCEDLAMGEDLAHKLRGVAS